MAASVCIIGGGILGAAAAFRLAQGGAAVTVLDANAGGATAASFGWINASFFLNPDHMHLRIAGIAAHRTLAAQLDVPVAWTGCIGWDVPADEQASLSATLAAAGYDLKTLTKTEMARMVPALAAPPEQAVFYGAEGVAESGAYARRLIRAAQDAGAIIMRGIRARHITTRNGVVTGVMTDVGAIPAEQILIAAGTATPTLLKEVDVHLPLRASAGAIVRTQAVPRVLDYVLAAPGQELRQDAAGHILLPTTANHQTADGPGDAPPHDLITQTLARANSLLGRDDLRCEDVRYAARPMPSDGLPVLGQAGPAGLFVAVMHSGVTLAAIAADVIAAKMQARPDRENQAALFDGFGVNRFSGN